MLLGVIAAVVVLVLLYLFASVKIVTQGHQYTIEHFGRFTAVTRPGFNFYPAFFYRVGRKVNMMEQVIDIPGQEITTRDNAMVLTDGVVFFQVLDPTKAAYEVSDLHVALQQITTTNLRTVMGSMDLDETLSKRDEINARLLGVVDHATNPWGVKITRVEIKDIRPPADIVNAMGRQMKAEREKQASILEAEGRRESAFRDSEARERAAEAEAKATQVVGDAIEAGGTQAIHYFIAQKYVEAVGKFATSPNARTILFPVEATQLIGTLGGIGQLAKEAPGETKPAAPAPPPRPKPGAPSTRRRRMDRARSRPAGRSPVNRRRHRIDPDRHRRRLTGGARHRTLPRCPVHQEATWNSPAATGSPGPPRRR